MNDRMVKKLAILVPHGSFHMSVGACLDAFGLAHARLRELHHLEDTYDLLPRADLLSADGRPVEMADGRILAVDGKISRDVAYDAIFISGYRVRSTEHFQRRMQTSVPILDWLAEQYERGAVIAGSGAALLLIAGTSLLNGIDIRLAPPLIPHLNAAFPRIRAKSRTGIVERERLILGHSLSADANVALRLLNRLGSIIDTHWLWSIFGSTHEMSSNHTYDSTGIRRSSDGSVVGDAQAWIEQHFTEDLNIGDLADQLRTSQQRLTRLFQKQIGVTPKKYLQRLRVESAQRMLVSTSLTIADIALKVGYNDIKAFREVFRANTGRTPSDFREK